jgi:isopentenyl-diphosphate delta-isomerase type 1
MNEEIFDVVNDRDEVIGQKPRSVIHRLKLKHRAVHVLVFNSKGELFLQKRSMKKDCFPGTWDSSASGHLDSGESYDACAVRESKEELGLTPAQAPERLFKIDACAKTGWEFIWIYRCRSDGPFVLHPDEIESGDWFSAGKLNRWLAEQPRVFAGAVPLIWGEMLQRSLVPVQATGRE